MKVSRSGAKTDGGIYNISELFHLKVRLGPNLAPDVRKILKPFMTKFAAAMTVVEVAPADMFPQTETPTLTVSKNKAPMKKVMHVKKTMTKKPAGKR